MTGALVFWSRIGAIFIISSLLSLLIGAIPIMIPGFVLGIVPAVCGAARKKYGLGFGGCAACLVSSVVVGFVSIFLTQWGIMFVRYVIPSLNFLVVVGVQIVLGSIVGIATSFISAMLLCLLFTLLIFLIPKKSKRVAAPDKPAPEKACDQVGDTEKQDTASGIAKELTATTP